MYDIFFLSHGEPMADIHWKLVHNIQPHARRIAGIDGILTAHRHCAQQARTSNFFVIDADNEVLDVDFAIRLPEYDRHYVHVWRAKNPVNGLVYGWGGIKLFPKKLLLSEHQMPVDMTTSFDLKMMPTVGSITHFNTSPFDTWRSSFRECVKLTNNPSQDSLERLAVWTNVAHGPYAEWCLHGARAGQDYGKTYRHNQPMLLKINDWTWLQEQFDAISH